MSRRSMIARHATTTYRNRHRGRPCRTEVGINPLTSACQRICVTRWPPSDGYRVTLYSNAKSIIMEVIYRKIADIHPLPDNPRTIGPDDLERLKESIRNNPDYLEAHPLVLSDRTGELIVIDGNQRLRACLEMGMEEVPTALLSGRDIDKLLAWDPEDLKGWGLDDISFEDNDSTQEETRKYTQKIEPPVYEPWRGNAPTEGSLCDTTKYDNLVARIESAAISEEAKAFLKKAATRHIVFDYGEIAEYYAHASKEVQELMEESALVIIDFGKAIENGYAKLRDDIYEIMMEDTDDEE